MGYPRSSTRQSIVVAKLKTLELSVRRGQSNFSTVYIFCQKKKKKRLLSRFFDRTGWIWQPLNFASPTRVCNGLKQIIFFGAFSIFESGGRTKHLITGPFGNSEFCFPSASMFPSASPRGTLSVSGKQNPLFPLWPVIKCLLANHLRASQSARAKSTIHLCGVY